jgi:hypothetical protein
MLMIFKGIGSFWVGGGVGRRSRPGQRSKVKARSGRVRLSKVLFYMFPHTLNIFLHQAFPRYEFRFFVLFYMFNHTGLF